MEKLNEAGELRKMLKPYKVLDNFGLFFSKRVRRFRYELVRTRYKVYKVGATSTSFKINVFRIEYKSFANANTAHTYNKNS